MNPTFFLFCFTYILYYICVSTIDLASTRKSLRFEKIAKKNLPNKRRNKIKQIMRIESSLVFVLKNVLFPFRKTVWKKLNSLEKKERKSIFVEYLWSLYSSFKSHSLFSDQWKHFICFALSQHRHIHFCV